MYSLKVSSTLLILLPRIYQLYIVNRNQKKRCLECPPSKFYCLQKVKHIKYKQIKGDNSASVSIEFTKIVDSHNRLYESIHKKCNEFKKKKIIYIGLKLDVRWLLKMIIGKYENGSKKNEKKK